MAFVSGDDPEGMERARDMLTAQVDQYVRQAMQMCWMALPKERRTIDEVERQVRRLVDRAVRDMREDADAFGIGG